MSDESRTPIRIDSQRSLFAPGERVRRDAAGPAPRYGAHRSAAVARSASSIPVGSTCRSPADWGPCWDGPCWSRSSTRGQSSIATVELPICHPSFSFPLLPAAIGLFLGAGEGNHVPQSVAGIPLRTRGAGRRFWRRPDRHLRRRVHLCDYGQDRHPVLATNPRANGDAHRIRPW